ncbi:hypothetical protein A2631_04135 [Candidatus Daviesbacteria bacterium RIFCSPHIGHO2_01_FULL_44_29]|uniref:Polyprenol-phosphate-mannose--protein mannosyltransferase n=1 Tax=Candidatus Daviesbacteria bacterium RIFCSPHIGHO2_02_FULL_43_12 TaxID=1797776 RepID=A0A1F5KGB4_9BACT|nr:MAG: hypothetical protein A2631_04135 [Candidatus Daviesbacteria bacterium RIFCSPHIGHO2_01_FULL_44_29]OGE39918.1 MAG: hypothetical protein A3D25_03865 [Candidatus Daviesbacteria bacterium RIFCSPHIGHO2_02_FULL_43_12]OGE40524.1 MAG: hypothetical protein A3E86_00920 [Candidatus Daviesbacteria bacterium RIFCSPHIGHO2_12_FULL_47_45]OGE70401.1 MAG: hypothetical protein A3B55_01705 [Candidatus Daviesbacteria bacterium RIFCSPLOWO2_01_FULL_43_15]
MNKETNIFLFGFSIRQALIILLIVTFFLRFFRISYPTTFVFDEVYHGFTAVQYSLGSKEAWEWWTTPPKGVAFEWTHPPLAKEIMASSLVLFRTEEPWGWRIPGALLGTICVYLVFLLGKMIFKNESVGLFSSFAFAFDGLNFVQSRTGMNDIYLVTFILASLVLFLRKKFVLSAILFGFALASKWAAIYLLGVYGVLLILDLKNFWKIIYFLIFPISVYLFSYLPFFWLGHTFDQFLELQRQMWYYHTHLKASHDYASPWWSWPFNLAPVWFHVDYYKDAMANIFTSGNPLLFWSGFVSMIFLIKGFILSKKGQIIYLVLTALTFTIFAGILVTHPQIIYYLNLNDPKESVQVVSSKKLSSLLTYLLLAWGVISGLLALFFTLKQGAHHQFLIIAGYFAFLLPWSVSPRIMFLYHYSACVPFMAIALGYFLAHWYKKQKDMVIVFCLMILVSFFWVYPFLTGLPLPKNLISLFFGTNLTKNPF